MEAGGLKCSPASFRLEVKMTPEIQEMLADTLVRILTIAKYELTGEAIANFGYSSDDYFFQPNGFAYDLPNMMLHYGFTTVDELNEPPILEYILTIPDPILEDTDGVVTGNNGEDQQRD